MRPYTFSIQVFASDVPEMKPLATMTGQVEADRYSTACVKAWQEINPGVNHLAALLGVRVAVGELSVKAA